MNYDLIFVLLFYFILYLIFLKYRERFEVQNKIFFLYKTQLGISWMKKIATTFPKTLHFLSYLSIFLGFSGMIFILFILVQGTIKLFTLPTAQPVVAPILPGISIPGAPTLSFWHWIIGILIIAIVHEFMHGVYSKLHNIKIKSSGFAFLGPILAAFVEPDERQLKKANKYTQLSIISAGPFANFVLAAFILAILILALNPLSNSLLTTNGVTIISIDETFPINDTLLRPGMTIDKINTIPIETVEKFASTLSTFSPGEVITITSNQTLIPIQLGSIPEDPTKARLGVSIQPTKIIVKENKQWFKPYLSTFTWITTLFFWLFTISLGVGLFNLLPLGPIDGGRMFLIASLWVTKDDETKAKKIWLAATFSCLFLLFLNLLPYLFKLLKFIFVPLLALII